MQGKPPLMIGRHGAYALGQLSKCALIDLVADLAKKEIGQEDASDYQICDQVQKWIGPVTLVRGDKYLDLRSIVAKHHKDSKPAPEPVPR